MPSKSCDRFFDFVIGFSSGAKPGAKPGAKSGAKRPEQAEIGSKGRHVYGSQSGDHQLLEFLVEPERLHPEIGTGYRPCDALRVSTILSEKEQGFQRAFH